MRRMVFAALRYECTWPRADRAWRAMVLALTVFVAGHAGLTRAEEAPTAPERSVKAAFLYKFTGYVDWPAQAFAEPESPIVMGVLGADDIAAELQQVTTNRTVNNRPLAVRKLREADPLTGLHVLFVGRSEAGRLSTLARAAAQRGILTVTDTPGALDHGSVINFIIVEGRVRFEIALEAAERSNVKLSSRLLAVAQTVRPVP